MTTRRRGIPMARIAIWAVVGLIAGLVVGVILQVATGSLSDAGIQVLFIGILGGVIAAVGALLIAGERRDGGSGRRPGM